MTCSRRLHASIEDQLEDMLNDLKNVYIPEAQRWVYADEEDGDPSPAGQDLLIRLEEVQAALTKINWP